MKLIDATVPLDSNLLIRLGNPPVTPGAPARVLLRRN